MRFKNYKNSYTNDNRIYSKQEMLDMTVREIKDRAEEFIAQHRVLGLPDEKELAGSDNVVHVNAYTRGDGTEVKAHWRSKPGEGSLNNETTTLNNEDDNNGTSTGKTARIEMDKRKLYEKNIPDNVAGVKRGKPMNKEQAGGHNVNPEFSSDDEGYKQNCTSCIPVHKAREQGFDIEALPASPNDVGQVKMLRAYPYYAYESVDGTKMESPTKIRSNNASECISQIENEIKTGECYEFWYHPHGQEDNYAHAVEISKNAENKLEIYDPQSGNYYGNEYFDDIDYKKDCLDNVYYPQYLFRIDDKKLKYDLLNKISKPSQRKFK